MVENKQKMRISDAEFELLKSTFAENGNLLLLIRNLFFGFVMSEEENKTIKQVFASTALRKLMRKQFLPELQADIPIGQCIDLWMTVDIKDKTPEEMKEIVSTRKILIEMIEQSLDLLEDPTDDKVDLSEWQDKTYNDLVARNMFISHVDQQLKVIETLSGVKTETVEETKNRLLKNSTK